MKFHGLMIVIFLVLTGCDDTLSPSHSLVQWNFLTGRNKESENERLYLYRILMPLPWKRLDPPDEQFLTDTTKSVHEFFINDEGQEVRITFHTFPIYEEERRISPHAQITRWKNQFDSLDVLSTHVSAESHNGFSGLYFEGKGISNGKAISVIGCSMQLASEYVRCLRLNKNPYDFCKCADYTIKASGSPEMINKHRLSIFEFARSFEFIDELPSPI